MAFFTKSAINIKREAKDAGHQTWHVCAQQTGRKRVWLNNAVASLAVAQAKLYAAEAEPINSETGEVRDTSAERIEVARLQSAVTRHQQSVSAAEAELEALRIAKDKAAAEFDFEEFLHGPLERLDKALHAVHTANQEVAKAAAAGVRVASEFTLPFLTEELIQSWQHRKELVCNPPARREPHPCTIVEFIRDYSAGSVGGGGYVKGDAAGWDPDKCAELIAQVSPSGARQRRRVRRS